LSNAKDHGRSPIDATILKRWRGEESPSVCGGEDVNQHFKEGKNDYTKERHRWLDQQSVEDVLQEMNKWKNVNDIAEYYGEHLTFVTPKSGFMSSYFESLARNQF
jgi:hypothetical protein